MLKWLSEEVEALNIIDRSPCRELAFGCGRGPGSFALLASILIRRLG